MTLRGSVCALAVALLAAVGCDSNPTQPTPATPLDTLRVFPVTDTLQVGESMNFTVVAIDTNGATVTNPVLGWHSTVPSVLSISQVGHGSALNEGGTMVIVSSGGQADTAIVVVVPAAGGWFTQPSGTSFDLLGVFMLQDGNTGWAVGAGGRIQRTVNAGATWQGQISNTSFTLNDVWFTTAAEGWAVGAGGTVMHTFDGGGTWTRVTVPASEVLNSVTFATRDTGWVVGATGVVLRTFDRGVTWSRTQPTPVTLRGVAFAGTREGWAVGDVGTIVGTHDRGLSWFGVAGSVTTQNLRAVTRPSITAARAAGDQGVVPRAVVGPDSVTWELQNAGASFQLFGAWSVDTSLSFAVGTNGGAGAVLRSDDGGANYTVQLANNPFRLNAVHFIDSRRGWAVGQAGTIVHTGSGGLP